MYDAWLSNDADSAQRWSAYLLAARETEELRADIRFLKSLWHEIKNRAESSKAPALIYHDLNVVERVLRDQVTSDFSQIWVDNEAEYERVLRFAQRVSAACDGVFDVTVGDVLVRHGFLPALPAQDAQPSEATWRDLVVLPGNRVWWRRTGRIDLGGIAKGYAVDMAIKTLQSHGVPSGLVNAGGDMRMFGEAQPVHVRLPDAPGILAPLGLFADCALATSAGYFSGVDSDGDQLEPLVDRERCIGRARRGSVTVVAADCMTADALTKVVRLAPRIAPKVLDSFDARAIVIDGTRQRSICGTRCDGGSTT